VSDFKCSYRAIFGLSEASKGVESEAFKGYKAGRSYLCSHGKGGILYWVALFKNGKETQGKAIAQYTTEDCDKLAARYANDIIKPGVTLGDLYQKAKATALVPLEQGVLSTCFYHRMVLVGDSWHKVDLQRFGRNSGASWLTHSSGQPSLWAWRQYRNRQCRVPHRWTKRSYRPREYA
jgi:hypothetical protein